MVHLSLRTVVRAMPHGPTVRLGGRTLRVPTYTVTRLRSTETWRCVRMARMVALKAGSLESVRLANLADSAHV
jgi:hypothetical protein